MKRIRHVLYASDFSAASRHAFATAVAMAKSLGAMASSMRYGTSSPFDRPTPYRPPRRHTRPGFR